MNFSSARGDKPYRFEVVLLPSGEIPFTATTLTEVIVWIEQYNLLMQDDPQFATLIDPECGVPWLDTEFPPAWFE